jgi:hypothetical protein
VGSFVGWLFGWLVRSLVGWLVRSFIRWLVAQPTKRTVKSTAETLRLVKVFPSDVCIARCV